MQFEAPFVLVHNLDRKSSYSYVITQSRFYSSRLRYGIKHAKVPAACLSSSEVIMPRAAASEGEHDDDYVFVALTLVEVITSTLDAMPNNAQPCMSSHVSKNRINT